MDEFDAILLVLFLIYVVVYLIRQRLFLRKNQFCPHCGIEMTMQRREQDVDTSKGPVRLGRMWLLAGRVRKRFCVLCCPQCGHEIQF